MWVSPLVDKSDFAQSLMLQMRNKPKTTGCNVDGQNNPGRRTVFETQNPARSTEFPLPTCSVFGYDLDETGSPDQPN